MNSFDLLHLSADDVRQALPMSAAIEAMRGAFAELSEGQVTLPVRACLQDPDGTGVNLVMPCHSPALKLFSTKTVTIFPGNREQGLPTTQGLLILTDGATGSHLAVMDGSSLTAIRTGAASGLATELLAREDASVVAVFGAGVQARTQLEAVCCVRRIERASVYSPSRTSADRFVAEMSDRLGIPIENAASPGENLAGADIVCTATSSSRPVLPEDAVPDGVHINAVGAYRPDMQEIPESIICRARIVVDHHESALEEAGDLLHPLQEGRIEASHFETELGSVLRGLSPGRSGPEEVTLFKSVGVAIQDLYAAAAAFQRIRQQEGASALT